MSSSVDLVWSHAANALWSLARYSDETTAHAVGRASGEALATSETQTCDLCPTGLDGSP